MPRLSVEEDWWTDPRRESLATFVGSLLLADAVALRMWRASQSYWKKDHSEVPSEVFDSLPYSQDLIKCGLAERRDKTVYVRGSAEHHEWLNERHQAASKGGKRSAERPRDELGRLMKSPKQTPSKHQANEEIYPSKLQASSSSSSSSSYSNTKNLNTVAPPPLVEDAPQKKEKSPSASQSAWQSYRDAFIRRWQTEPIRNAMVNGQLSNLIARVGRESAPDLLAFYVQSNEAYYVRQRHSIGIALKDCEKLMTDLERAKQGIAKPNRTSIDEQSDQRTNNLITKILGDKINAAKKSSADGS